MAGRNIIVIAASAGGVEAMMKVAGGLPADLPAAVFVVVHFPPDGTSLLPEILARAGPLPAMHPRDREPVRPGTIYVAPPDRHLLLEDGVVRLVHGPRENGHRPAADALFRTAARAHGRRVVGVVLTGNLDDGTAGLSAIRRRGGVTVVQDPAEALYRGMPESALANVVVDHVCRLDELPGQLAKLAREPMREPEVEMSDDQLEMEADIAEMDPGAMEADDRPGIPSGFTCPECSGVLWEIHDGELVRFRCRVGHAYGVEALLASQAGAVEAALWTALRALRERAAFSRNMARKMEARGNLISYERFADRAADADARAQSIEQVLRSGDPSRAEGNGRRGARGEEG